MRLIDADKLNFSEQHYNKSQMKAILDFIDNQPTAYDVDKVVEQLEERSILSRPVGWSKFYKIATLKDAIKIVKRGGTNESV